MKKTDKIDVTVLKQYEDMFEEYLKFINEKTGDHFEEIAASLEESLKEFKENNNFPKWKISEIENRVMSKFKEQSDKAVQQAKKEGEDYLKKNQAAIDKALDTTQDSMRTLLETNKIVTESSQKALEDAKKAKETIEQQDRQMKRDKARGARALKNQRAKAEKEARMKTEQAKSMYFEAAPSADYEVIDIPGIGHKYKHTRVKTAKLKSGKEVDLSNIRQLSVTKLASLITHNFEDFEALAKENAQRIADFEAQYGKTPLDKDLRKKHSELLALQDEYQSADLNLKRAQKRGTAFHKVVELVEKGQVSLNDLTEKKIEELGKQYDEIGEGFSFKYGETKVRGTTSKDLLKLVKQYDEFKKQTGLSGQTTTETPLGMLVDLGDEVVEVAGTFDSIFNEMSTLIDFKTSGRVDVKKIGIQLNLLKKMALLNPKFMKLKGIKGLDALKVFHLPFKGGEGGVYDVGTADDAMMWQWIKSAFDILAGETTEKPNVPVLMRGKLTLGDWQDKKKKTAGKQWLLNNISLKKLAENYEKGTMSYEEIMDNINSLNEEDRRHFINLIWSTKEYEEKKKTQRVYKVVDGKRVPLLDEQGNIRYDESGKPLYEMQDIVSSVPPRETGKLYRQGALWDRLRGDLDSFQKEIEKVATDEYANIADKMTKIQERISKIKISYAEAKEYIPDEQGNLQEVTKLVPANEKEKAKENRRDKLIAQREALRAQLAGKASSAFSEQVFKTEQGYGSAQTVGGGFLSEWAKAYRIHAEQDDGLAEKIADRFVSYILNAGLSDFQLDELKGGLAGIATKDEANQAFVDAIQDRLLGKHSIIASDLDRVQKLEDQIKALNQERASLDKGVPNPRIEEIDKLVQRLIAEQDRLKYAQEVGGIFSDEPIGINEMTDDYALEKGKKSAAMRGEAATNRAARMISRLKAFSEYDLSDKNFDDVMNFIKGLTGIRNEFKGFLNALGSSENSEIDEYGVPEYIEKSETILDAWTDFVRNLRNKVKGLENLDEDQVETAVKGLDIATSTEEDIGGLAKKTGHKLSWLYQLKDIYDEFLSPEMEKVNESLPDKAKFTSVEQYAKSRLTQEQYEQYASSIDFRKMVLEGKDLSTVIKQFLDIPEFQLKSNLASTLQKALVKVMEANPKLLDDTIYNIFMTQTDLGGGAKMRWWHDVGAAERLRRGDVVRNWAYKPNEVLTTKPEMIAEAEERAEARVRGDLGNREAVNLLEKRAQYSRKEYEQRERAIAKEIKEQTGFDLEDYDKRYGFEEYEKAYLDLYKFALKVGRGESHLEEFMKGELGYSEIDGAGTTGTLLTKEAKQEYEELRQGLAMAQSRLPNLEDMSDEGKRLFIERQQLLEEYRVPYERERVYRDVARKRYGSATDESLILKQQEAVLAQIKSLPEQTLSEVTSEIGDAKSVDVDANSITVGEPEKVVNNAETTEIKADTVVVNESQSATAEAVEPTAETKTPKKRRGRPRKKKTDDTTPVTPTTPPTDGGGTEPPTESETTKSDAQKAYNALVAEEFRIKKEIAALDKERWKSTEIERKKDTDYAVQNLDAEKQWREAELERIKDRKTELEGLGAVESKATTASNEEKMTAYLTRLGVGADGKMTLTPEEQADYWSQYERALDKQARAEEEIFGIRNKAQTSYGTEKTLLYQIADEKAKALATDEANVAMLEKIVGKLDPTRLANIKEQVALNQQLYKLQALKQTRGATSIWDVMANDIKRATMRIADFGIAAKVLNKIPQDIQKVIQYTKELDAAMTNIRIVGGYNEEQARNLMRSYTELGRTLGATTSEIAQGMNDWLRQGYEASDQLEALVSASTKLSKLGMVSASEATTALTSALKAFNLAAEDAIKVVDKLTKVDQLAAVSAGGISQALSKSATSAKLAGMSMDELIGSVSVIGEVTQQSMDTVGNAMKSILARYGNVKASVFTQMGLNDDGETTDNINDIEKVLSKLGIKVRSSAKEMRSITDVLDDVNSKWSTFDTVTKNAIATAFGGTRMRENFLVLMENWNRVKELTEESANAAGTADEKYSAYLDSIEASTKKLQNAWEGFTQSIKGSGIIKGLTDAETWIVNFVNKYGPYLLTFFTTLQSKKIMSFLGNSVTQGVGYAKGFFGSIGGKGRFHSVKFGENGIETDEFGNVVTGNKVGLSSRLLNKIFGGNKTNSNNQVAAIDKTTQAVNDLKRVVENIGTGRTLNGTAPSKLVGADGKPLSGDASDSSQPTTGPTITGYRERNRLFSFGNPKVIQLTNADGTTQNIMREGSNWYYTDANGKSTGNQVTDQNILSQVGQTQKAAIAQNMTARAYQAAIGELSAYITELSVRREVGDKSTFFNKLFSKWAGNYTNQTVEETHPEKTRRLGWSTQLAAIGGFLGGSTGASLGQQLGVAIANGISTRERLGELQMKQRVEDAKESLKFLEQIASSTSQIESVVESGALDSKGYEQLQNYIDDLTKQFAEYDGKNFKEMSDVLAESLGLAKGTTYVQTLNKMQEKLLDSSVEERKETVKALKIATAKSELEQIKKSQEKDRRDITSTDTVNLELSTTEKALLYGGMILGGGLIGSGIGSVIGMAGGPVGAIAGGIIGGITGNIAGGVGASAIQDAIEENLQTYYFSGSLENRLKQAQEKREEIKQKADELAPETDQLSYKIDRAHTYLMQGVSKLDEYIDKVQKNIAKLASMDREVMEKQIEVGYLASNLSSLTTDQLSGLTIEGAIGKVAEAMRDQGYAVYDAAGAIKDEYLPMIKSAILSNSEMAVLTKGDTQTIGELADAYSNLAKRLELVGLATQGIDYEKLRYLLDHYGDDENATLLNNVAAVLNVSVDKLKELVYAADPERIEQFASAWNLTVEQARNMAKIFPDLTTSIGLMSGADVRSYYAGFSTFFTDLADNGEITAENFEKILSNYPQLLKYLRQGNDVLAGVLVDKTVNEQKEAYINSLLNAEMTSKDFAEDFKKTLKESGGLVAGGLTYDVDQLLGNQSTLDAILEKARQMGGDVGQAIVDAVTDYMDFEQVIEWTDPLLQKAIEAQQKLLDRQIENLTEQKDALSQVNEERKKELELMKAQEALENAKKERVRVYRAGVGFVYESDETAVQTAQENLISLNTQKQQEDLQVQIDQLELQKSILSNLEENKQLSAMQTSLDTWSEKNLAGNAEIVSALSAAFSNNKIYYNAAKGTYQMKDEQGNWILDEKGNIKTANSIAGLMESKESLAQKAIEDAVEARSAVEEAYKALDNAANIKDYRTKLAKYEEEHDEYVKARNKAVNSYGATDEQLGSYLALSTTKKTETFEATGLLTELMMEKVLMAPHNQVQISTLGLSLEKLDSIIKAIQNKTEGEYDIGLGRILNIYGDGTMMITQAIGYEPKKNATGTTSFQGGQTLINELGTEAVITPGGTLTALPSKTGIVPADITRNVWALGEVAPTLVAQLSSLNQKALTGNAGNTTYEEGQYIDNLTMNVYPTKDYDMDKLLSEARAKVKLTRHNN